MIRDTDSLWGYDIHEFIRDKDIFGVFYKLIIDKEKFEDRTNYCSLDLVPEGTQRS